MVAKFKIDWLEDSLDDDERSDYEAYLKNLKQNQTNQEVNKSND